MHSWSHHKLTDLTDAQIIAETVWTARAIYQAIGVVPKFFRAPYGASDNRVQKGINSMGLYLVKWDHDTVDWSGVDSTKTAIAWSLNTTKPGIILQHDLENTVI
jgi:peptidoglycan/xylan/chitin deacetylase (PgdA/CDA1 family)